MGVLGDVAPVFPSDYAADGLPTNAVAFCQGSIRYAPACIFCSDGFDVSRGQSGVACQFAGMGSPLDTHVVHIVGMGASEKMLWIHAWRIVAFVTDMHSLCKRPEVQLPGQAMCAHRAATGLRRDAAMMAIRVASTNPQPAGTKVRRVRGDGAALGDLAPKALLKRRTHVALAVLGEKGPVGSAEGVTEDEAERLPLNVAVLAMSTGGD